MFRQNSRHSILWRQGMPVGMVLGLLSFFGLARAEDPPGGHAWAANVQAALLRVADTEAQLEAADSSPETDVLGGVRANLEATLALYHADGNQLAAETTAAQKDRVHEPAAVETEQREALRKLSRERAEAVRERAYEAASRREGEHLARERGQRDRRSAMRREGNEKSETEQPGRSAERQETKSLPAPHPRVVNALQSQQEQIDALRSELGALQHRVRELSAQNPMHRGPEGSHAPRERERRPEVGEHGRLGGDREVEQAAREQHRAIRHAMEQRLQAARERAAAKEQEAHRRWESFKRAVREHDEQKAGIEEARRRLHQAQRDLAQRERRFMDAQREVDELRARAERSRQEFDRHRREIEAMERMEGVHRENATGAGERRQRQSRKPELPADAI